jgi:hypothetical protein
MALYCKKKNFEYCIAKIKKVKQKGDLKQKILHILNSTPMIYSRFHYILIFLVFVIIYLIYLIGYYKIQDFKTTSYMESMQNANNRTMERNKEKEFLAQYIRTPAYQSQVAKATHNKKLPGEEAINIIKPNEAESNREIDSSAVIAAARRQEEDPTKNMTNPEKWWYLVERGIE